MKRLERIVKRLGGDLYDRGQRALIPGPGHSDADRSVSLLETPDGRIIVHCFSSRDDWRAVRQHLAAHGLLDGEPSPDRRDDGSARPRPIAVQPRNEARIERARRIWAEGRPIVSTLAARYLRLRGVAALPPGDDALRFHPRMTSYDDRQRRPALLAAHRDGGGEVQGVEVTLLSAHGSGKAAVRTPQRVIGDLMHGAVRLYPPSDALVIAEGVPTALSAHDYLDLPAWAALAGCNLAMFTPPPGVKRLLVAHDNDAASRRACWKLARRLCGSVRVEAAPAPARVNDWNDWAQQGGLRARA